MPAVVRRSLRGRNLAVVAILYAAHALIQIAIDGDTNADGLGTP